MHCKLVSALHFYISLRLLNGVIVEDTSNYRDICDSGYWSQVKSLGHPTLPIHLKSPNYPDNYPIRQRCMWSMNLREYHHLTVLIEDLAMGDEGVQCNKDYAIIDVTRYCKSQQEGIIYLNDDDLEQFIAFISDYRYTNRGFALTIRGELRNPTTLSTTTLVTTPTTTTPTTTTTVVTTRMATTTLTANKSTTALPMTSSMASTSTMPTTSVLAAPTSIPLQPDEKASSVTLSATVAQTVATLTSTTSSSTATARIPLTIASSFTTAAQSSSTVATARTFVDPSATATTTLMPTVLSTVTRSPAALSTTTEPTMAAGLRAITDLPTRITTTTSTTSAAPTESVQRTTLTSEEVLSKQPLTSTATTDPAKTDASTLSAATPVILTSAKSEIPTSRLTSTLKLLSNASSYEPAESTSSISKHSFWSASPDPHNTATVSKVSKLLTSAAVNKWLTQPAKDDTKRNTGIGNVPSYILIIAGVTGGIVIAATIMVSLLAKHKRKQRMELQQKTVLEANFRNHMDKVRKMMAWDDSSL